jgi:hypothetical protein
MLRRVLMRRAYNSGRYEQARHYARLLLGTSKEAELARSIIVRSYWNEQAYEDLIQTALCWDDEISLSYVHLAKERLNSIAHGHSFSPVAQNRLKHLLENQPRPKESREWSTDDMTANFLQEGERVWFRYPQGYVFWDMPAGFDLSTTHTSLLALAAETLLYPWESSTKAPFSSTRPMGERASLSFSAGSDSTAAALVMPSHTLLGYHRRSFESILDHRNARRLIDYLNNTREREVVQIESNHELIRTHHGKPGGFSSDFACAVHLILLADHFGLGAIGFGMPLDNTYLWKGRKFRRFEETDYYIYWTKRFADAGLDLLFPIASISEAGALMVVKKSPWLEHLNSCMRGDGKQGCGRCWKCFHKNGPLGRPFDINAREIQTFLNKRPMPTATHALWALQKMRHEDEVSDLTHLFELNYDWWEKIFPPGFLLLPDRWRSGIEAHLRSMLPLMPEPYELYSVNHFSED